MPKGKRRTIRTIISDDASALSDSVEVDDSETNSSASHPQSSENRALVTSDGGHAAPELPSRNTVLPSGIKMARREYFPSNPTAFFELFELDLVEYPHMESQLSRYKYVLNCLTEAQYHNLGDKRPNPEDPFCYDKLKSALLELGRPPPDQEIDALYEGTNFSNLAPSAVYNRLIAIITASRKQLADKPILHEILLHRFLKYLPLEIAMILRMTSKHTDLREALLAAEQAFRPASFNQTLNSMSSDSLNRTRTSLTATDASRIAQQLSCA